MLSVSNTVSSWIYYFFPYIRRCLFTFYIGVVIRSVRQKYLILLYHARQTIPTPVIMQEKTSTWRKTRNYANNCHLLLSPSKLSIFISNCNEHLQSFGDSIKHSSSMRKNLPTSI